MSKSLSPHGFFCDFVVLLSLSFYLPGLFHLVSPCLSVPLNIVCDIFSLGLWLVHCKTLSNGRYASCQVIKAGVLWKSVSETHTIINTCTLCTLLVQTWKQFNILTMTIKAATLSTVRRKKLFVLMFLLP